MKMDATSTVDLQSVKALADENALLREEVRALRDQLHQKQAVERELNHPPVIAGNNSGLKPHELHYMQQQLINAQAREYKRPAAENGFISSPAFGIYQVPYHPIVMQANQLQAMYAQALLANPAYSLSNKQLWNSNPTHPPSSPLRGLGDSNGSLKGQLGLNALLRERSCQLGSWTSAGGLEWSCKLQLADTYLAADFTIRRPTPSKQLQITYSVQFAFKGEVLETAHNQHTVLDMTETSAIVCVQTNKFDKSEICQFLCSRGYPSINALNLSGEIEVAIQIHSIVASPSSTETSTRLEKQIDAVRDELGITEAKVVSLEAEIEAQKTGTNKELEERIAQLENEINILKTSAVQPIVGGHNARVSAHDEELQDSDDSESVEIYVSRSVSAAGDYPYTQPVRATNLVGYLQPEKEHDSIRRSTYIRPSTAYTMSEISYGDTPGVPNDNGIQLDTSQHTDGEDDEEIHPTRFHDGPPTLRDRTPTPHPGSRNSNSFDLTAIKIHDLEFTNSTGSCNCFNCGEEGHQSADCQEPKQPSPAPAEVVSDFPPSSAAQLLKCYNCDAYGHQSMDCPVPKQPRSAGFGSGFSINSTVQHAPRCYNCDQPGHRSMDCPEPSPFYDNSNNFFSQPALKCFNCGREGHRVRECIEPRKPAVVCYSCGIRGHKARECPKKPAKRSNPNVLCYNCGATGHRAIGCPLLKAPGEASAFAGTLSSSSGKNGNSSNPPEESQGNYFNFGFGGTGGFGYLDAADGDNDWD